MKESIRRPAIVCVVLIGFALLVFTASVFAQNPCDPNSSAYDPESPLCNPCDPDHPKYTPNHPLCAENPCNPNDPDGDPSNPLCNPCNPQNPFYDATNPICADNPCNPNDPEGDPTHYLCNPCHPDNPYFDETNPRCGENPCNPNSPTYDWTHPLCNPCDPENPFFNQNDPMCIPNPCNPNDPEGDPANPLCDPCNPQNPYYDESNPICIKNPCNPNDPEGDPTHYLCNPCDPQNPNYDAADPFCAGNPCDPNSPNTDPTNPLCNPCDPENPYYEPNSDFCSNNPCDPASQNYDPYNPHCDPCNPQNPNYDETATYCMINPCDPVSSYYDPYDPICDPCNPDNPFYDAGNPLCQSNPCDDLSPNYDPFDPLCNPCDPANPHYDPESVYCKGNPCDPIVTGYDPYAPVCDPCNPDHPHYDPTLAICGNNPCDPLNPNYNPYDPICDPCNPDHPHYDPSLAICGDNPCDPLNPNYDPFDPLCDPCNPDNSNYSPDNPVCGDNPCDPLNANYDPYHPLCDPCNPENPFYAPELEICKFQDPCDPQNPDYDPLDPDCMEEDPCDPDSGNYDPTNPYCLLPDPCDPQNPAFNPSNPDCRVTRIFGVIVDATQTPVTGDSPNSLIYIDAVETVKGYYETTFPNGDGTFQMDLPAGKYELYVWPDETAYPNLLPSAVILVDIEGGETNVGGIVLPQNEPAFITGTLRDTAGNGIPGIAIEAYEVDGDRLAEAQTDGRGFFRIDAEPGEWQVAPWLADTGFFFAQSSTTVSLVRNEEAVFDIVVSGSARVITGEIVDDAENRVTDFTGTAFAYNPEGFEVVSDDWVMDGEFELPLPPGEFRIGLLPEPESPYLPVEDIPIGDDNTVTVTARKPDAVIKGTLIGPDGKAATGISGFVYGVQEGNDAVWQAGEINRTDGTYRFTVSPGNWRLTYELETPSFAPAPDEPIRVPVVSGTTITRNITLIPLVQVVRGRVTDEGGRPVPGVQVWGRLKRTAAAGDKAFEGTIVSDANGYFEIPVPTVKEARRRNTVQVCLTTAVTKCGTDPHCLKEARRECAKPGAGETTLILRTAETTVTGRVVAEDGVTPVAGASVSAFSSDGQNAEGVTDENGNYSLRLAGNKGRQNAAEWMFSAALKQSRNPEPGFVFFRSPELPFFPESGDGVLPDLVLQPVGSMPLVAKQRFAPDAGWNGVLSDGTRIRIPAGAVSTEKPELKLTIEARVRDMPDTADNVRLAYGYALRIYEVDAVGTTRLVNRTFDKEVVITLRYTDEMLARQNATVADIRPAVFSTTYNAWQPVNGFTIDDTEKTVTFTVDHFSNWSLTALRKGTVIAPETPPDEPDEPDEPTPPEPTRGGDSTFHPCFIFTLAHE